MNAEVAMKLIAKMVLFTIIAVFGCTKPQKPPLAIFNIPGPEIRDEPDTWELYEYSFKQKISPNHASYWLQQMGYKLLGPDDQYEAEQYVLGQGRVVVSLWVWALYIDHPIITLIDQNQPYTGYALGFKAGAINTPAQTFDIYKKLDQDCGWLVKRKKPK